MTHISFSCDDFYEYSCGRFLRETSIPVRKTIWNAFEIVDHQVKEQLLTIFNEPIDYSQIKPFQNLKKFYKACMNLTAIERIGIRQFRKTIVNELGGWPVLSNQTWNDSKWTWTDAIVKLRSYGLPFNSIFSFEILPDFRNSSIRVAKVKIPYHSSF